MARLRLEGVTVGELTVDKIGPVAVKIGSTASPFEMEGFGQGGLESKFLARSLLWESRTMGVIVEDKDGLFHAAQTTTARPPYGAAIKFTVRENPDFKSIELVMLPLFEFAAGNAPPSMTSPCHVPDNPTPLTPIGDKAEELAQALASATKEWDRWWRANVDGHRDPPAPPKALADAFTRVTSALFDTPASEIAVVTKPGEMISDRLSIDLFDTSARGHGGGSRSDIDARVSGLKAGQMNVVLQLLPDAFRGSDPILGLISTGIHEAAHYRHYALTRELIRRWQASSPGNRSRKVTEKELRTEFGQFLDREFKAKRLTFVGRLIVHSTFNVEQATHPFAQIHGFMGVYPFYPRERAGTGKKGGLLHQRRFAQLEAAAMAWREARSPIMNTLPFEVLSSFAMKEGPCAITDLRELAAEVAAAAPQFDSRAAPFYQRLDTALASLPK